MTPCGDERADANRGPEPQRPSPGTCRTPVDHHLLGERAAIDSIGRFAATESASDRRCDGRYSLRKDVRLQ